jgi:hypothetical protein
MAMDIDLIWDGGEANYFLNEDWTGQITLKPFRKLVFARRAFSTNFCAERPIEHVFRPRRANRQTTRDNLSTRSRIPPEAILLAIRDQRRNSNGVIKAVNP